MIHSRYIYDTSMIHLRSINGVLGYMEEKSEQIIKVKFPI